MTDGLTIKAEISSLPNNISARIKIAESGCWLWTGAKKPSGYAMLYDASIKRTVRAHRRIYELLRGAIPMGLVVDHLCRVRHCVNPNHLEVVTSRVNTLRGISPAAKKASQTTCVNGHPLEGENLYIHPTRGTRNCRTCLHEQSAKRRVNTNLPCCIVDGCSKPGSSRQMCSSHYMRWWRYER